MNAISTADDDNVSQCVKAKGSSVSRAPDVGSRGQISLLVNSLTKIDAALFWIIHEKDLFANLLAQRDTIETDLEFALEWDDSPDSKASKAVVSRHGDCLDEAKSQELDEWLATTGDAFARALPKYL